ncbi:iron ABC transporter permease [Nocardioides sp. SOB77]|uniref:Iron ABC transporter permease n=1 Tax=Nocardioides oceani TaxID=3058369 RepID=A0ABT8FAP4_9ACTN|nr:iron ABC transporter permease [Nocardioides oceani]MDN4171742.1 iron ABC transporter permease [Nocardioides oceani]
MTVLLARRTGGAGRPGWSLLVLLVAAVVASPVLGVSGYAVAQGGLRVPGGTGAMVATTAVLLGLVAAGTAVLGTGLAWLVTAYDFPLRRTLGWLLVLPLAMPAYILGFVYLSTFDYAGPVQTWLRSVLGDDLGVGSDGIPVRSVGGAAVVLVLTLYPYVYLMTRAALAETAPAAYDAARSLGAGPGRAFRTVLLPLVRPSLAAGLALVMMETLTDFATVQYFGVRTLSVGVYLAWKGSFDVGSAIAVAVLVLLAAVAVLAAERVLRGRARFSQRGGRGRGLAQRRLTGPRAATATGCALLVVALAFGLPLARLGAWAAAALADDPGAAVDERFADHLGSSVTVAAIVAGTCVLVSLLMAHALRLGGGRVVRGAAQLTTFGYAVPGAVVGIGVLVVFQVADRALVALGVEGGTGLLVTGSVLGVLMAYVVRFTGPAYQAVDASFSRVPPTVTQSALALGAGPLRLLARVHLPLVRPGVAVALTLVVVDAVKELPLVLLLRPFGFTTLSVWVYELASENFWEQAALPALLIVALALVPVALLNRSSRPVDPRAGVRP